MANIAAPTAAEINSFLALNESAPNFLDPSDTDYQEEKVTNGISVGIFGGLVFLAFVVFFITRAVCCLCCEKVRSLARCHEEELGWLPAVAAPAEGVL